MASAFFGPRRSIKARPYHNNLARLRHSCKFSGVFLLAGRFEGRPAALEDAPEAGGQARRRGFLDRPGSDVLARGGEHEAHGAAQGRDFTHVIVLAPAEALAGFLGDGTGRGAQPAQGAQLHMNIAQGRDLAAGRGQTLVFLAEKTFGKGDAQGAEQGAESLEGFARIVHGLGAVGAAQFRQGQGNFFRGDSAEGIRQRLVFLDAVTHASGSPKAVSHPNV